MRTDVQTLIAALTTERDSLTRAIEGLKNIRTSEPVAVAVAKPARKKGYKFSAETRARMKAGQQRRHAAARAALANTNGTPPTEQSDVFAAAV
jgi:hypothetical protein